MNIALPVKKTDIRRAQSRIRDFLSNPANIILLVTVSVLGFFTLYPLVLLVADTVKVNIADLMYPELIGKKVGDVTDFHWKRMLFSEMSGIYFRTPLRNAVVMSLLASVISIIYGGTVAFLITRTDMKGKKFISSVFIFPYIMPSWTIATFWKNFFQNPDIGSYQGGLLYWLTGIKVPEAMVYGLVPCAIVLGLHYAPFAYILIGGILRNMDANLEEAATILKASRAKIIGKITLPIVLPALLSTFLLVFSSSMSAYAVPQFLGGAGGFNVLTTTLKQFITNGWYGQGYIMAIFMIVFGLAILGINQMVTGSRRSFTTVTGKSGQVSYIKLGVWKYIVAAVLFILCIFCSFMPLVSFALESCTFIPGDYSRLTLAFWIDRGYPVENGLHGLFFENQVWSAFRNSLVLSASCAIFAGTVGMLIGYAVARKRGTKLAKAADNIAFLPYLMPSMAMGAAFLAIGAKMGLSKTMALLIIVGSIKYLPFASRSGINAMLQLSGEIEEAAIIVNVKWWKRMLKIIFPIQKSTFISGYLLPFTSCMRELSLFTLLSSGSIYLMTTLLEYWQVWCDQSANALNLLIVITVLAVNLLVNKLTGASIDKGVGG
ncbi:MAG: iron ABC transporter permease [Sphaerochaetaceae bacterium]|nr:iron ABC transporter permease [Sphaerochaetaceae bacterium]